MSEYRTPDYESAIAEDGTVVVPASYLRTLGLSPGDRVEVRVTEKVVSAALRKRGVTAEEVDEIGNRQLEGREQVLAFLSAEGSLSGNKRARVRLEGWLGSFR
jgi:bifunctional DNA-binding transcriptional regulator/antitoxin component of YhaV-PrlF toxin-antitoxin module